MAHENNLKEEVLELIWDKKEKGDSIRKEELLKTEEHKITNVLIDEMVKGGYLLESNGEINLAKRGKDLATHIIRSHRLAERLFVDVLEMGEEFLESNACTFEHILGPEMITAICTLLGHPYECPHGRPIPRGECCKKEVKEIESVVLPLSELKAGEKGKILYIATKHHPRLDKLTALGVSPGEEVKIHQVFPSFVIKIGETDIALDTEVLKDIFVRKIRV